MNSGSNGLRLFPNAARRSSVSSFPDEKDMQMSAKDIKSVCVVSELEL
jgi:hypothetical protein